MCIPIFFHDSGLDVHTSASPLLKQNLSGGVRSVQIMKYKTEEILCQLQSIAPVLQY